MQVQPALSFRGVSRSARLEADLLARIAKLGRYYRPIIACKVRIEVAEHRHGSANRYHVRIDLTVPYGELVVAHEASVRSGARALRLPKLARADEPDPGHRYIRTAIRDAFGIARRRLQDYARRQRGAVKSHPRARRRVERIA